MADDEKLLHSRLDLASTLAAVHWGRAHATDVFRQWDLPQSIADDAIMIASELLTNAVQHAGAAELPKSQAALQCSLLLWLTERGLTVGVYDFDTSPPVLRLAAPDDERGRGLALVECLSERWGYTPLTPAPGKVVWARLTVPQWGTQSGLRASASPRTQATAVMGA